MKKRYFTTVLLCAALFLTGCDTKYEKDAFIGQTSSQIISRYGEFDCVTVPADEDGLYKNCRCGYTIENDHTDFFSRSEEILFFITFDDNGIAADCAEGCRPGG